MEESPRASDSATSTASTRAPPRPPEPASASRASAAAAAAWSSPPATQTHLRRGFWRMKPATNSCGSRAPASRIGTSRPTIHSGAPITPSSQGSTSRALASSSASLLPSEATRCRKKLRGCSWQASSGMSRHIRLSSSPVNHS